MASDPLDWTLSEAAAALAKGTVSSEELTKLCLARIGKLDRVLNAFITLQEESALEQARECDRQRKAGRNHDLGRRHEPASCVRIAVGFSVGRQSPSGRLAECWPERKKRPDRGGSQNVTDRNS